MTYYDELKRENDRLKRRITELNAQLRKARSEIRSLVAPDLPETITYSYDENAGRVTLTDG